MTCDEKGRKFAEELMAACERHGIIVRICQHGTIFCFCSPEQVATWEKAAFKDVQLVETKEYRDFLENKD